MANVISDNKLFFAIEGLPRSGTTILNSIFNSIEDAFCFSEPIWQLIQNPYGLRLGKLDDKIAYNSIAANNVVLELRRVLQTCDYNIGGLKETYRDWQTECVDLIKDEDLDFRIFILREPKYNFSGWKRNPFGPEYYNVEIFCRNYCNFIERIYKKALSTPTYIIKYEDLCSAQNIEKYINTLMEGKIEISGKINILKTGYSYGDIKGNNSNKIETSRKTTDNLTIEELKKISEIEPLYDNMGSGRC
jgi:hypothetical protein